VRRLARELERSCDRRGWRYPEASTGLDRAGHLDVSAMIDSIRSLGRCEAASAELATHPGEHGDGDLARYEWGYHWGAEADALRSDDVRREVERAGFRLGTFGDLVAPVP
jgi:hypothetical protein